METRETKREHRETRMRVNKNRGKGNRKTKETRGNKLDKHLNKGSREESKEKMRVNGTRKMATRKPRRQRRIRRTKIGTSEIKREQRGTRIIVKWNKE